MIEIEKKFLLNEKDKKLIIENAQFLSERVFTDIYYDTKNFFLTSHDRWLRSRENKFELKIPLHKNTERITDQYDEIQDEQKIRDILNLSKKGSLSENLIEAEYISFCICKTTRKKYKHGLFTIDLDVVDFQDFTYTIGEIEVMVSDESEVKNAVKNILTFAEEHHLNITPIRGKVIEYLKRIRPDHYQALIKTGVIKDF